MSQSVGLNPLQYRGSPLTLMSMFDDEEEES